LRLVVELVRHAAAHWAAVLVLNGRGGNRDALREAADLCRYEGRRLKIVHVGTAGMDAHAGRADTSMMLHLAPERVRVDLAERGVIDPVATLLPTRSCAGGGRGQCKTGCSVTRWAHRRPRAPGWSRD
jgi:creatinine amidohydrolase/Fe(II)-dependent formamide hydrolase-like protein